MRGILFISLYLFCSLGIASEGAKKFTRLLTKNELIQISKCSHAVNIVVMAADRFPYEDEERFKLVWDIYNGMKERNILGDSAPTGDEILMAHARVDGLLRRVGAPKTPELHNWLVAQAASACTLQMLLMEPSREK